MIKANIEAQIENLKHEREQVRDKIIQFDKWINDMKAGQKELLERETDLCYEIEELEEQLNE